MERNDLSDVADAYHHFDESLNPQTYNIERPTARRSVDPDMPSVDFTLELIRNPEGNSVWAE